MKTVRTAVVAAFLFAAAGCASIRPFEAGNDVHALLLAVRDDDRRAFETYIDRPTLRANLQVQLLARARSAGGGGTGTALGVLLSGPASRLAEGVLIQPEILRAVAMYYGYRPRTAVPSPLGIGSALRPASAGEVCAPVNRTGPCLITFAREGRTWRLVDIDIAGAERLARHS